MADGFNLQGIGGILSLIGAYGSAQSQKDSLRAQAGLDEINATTAENSARAALLAGQYEQQRGMISTANLKASQKVGFAANGVDLGEGSAQRTLTSTDVLGEIDKNTIGANAVRAAWGYRTQAVSLRNSAMAKGSMADAASPVLAGATSMLNSASAVASNWYGLKKTGALDNGTAPRASGFQATPQAGP